MMTIHVSKYINLSQLIKVLTEHLVSYGDPLIANDVVVELTTISTILARTYDDGGLVKTVTHTGGTRGGAKYKYLSSSGKLETLKSNKD